MCVCVMECLLFFFLSGIRCEILSYSNVCMCFNVRLQQCNQNTSVWRWLRSVWIKCCVWGKKCCVCVCSSSCLAYFLFLTTWETTSRGKQTTSHHRDSHFLSLSVHFTSLHSEPFPSFFFTFCFFLYSVLPFCLLLFQSASFLIRFVLTVKCNEPSRN